MILSYQGLFSIPASRWNVSFGQHLPGDDRDLAAPRLSFPQPALKCRNVSDGSRRRVFGEEYAINLRAAPALEAVSDIQEHTRRAFLDLASHARLMRVEFLHWKRAPTVGITQASKGVSS